MPPTKYQALLALAYTQLAWQLGYMGQKEEAVAAREKALEILERLVAKGEMETARKAHAEYFLALAEKAEPELVGPEQTLWLERLERVRPGVSAAARAHKPKPSSSSPYLTFTKA